MSELSILPSKYFLVEETFFLGNTWKSKVQQERYTLCHCRQYIEGFRLFTYTPGIFRRISEQQYRHTEMATPATKF
jgi:hypothetical protein